MEISEVKTSKRFGKFIELTNDDIRFTLWLEEDSMDIEVGVGCLETQIELDRDEVKILYTKIKEMLGD